MMSQEEEKSREKDKNILNQSFNSHKWSYTLKFVDAQTEQNFISQRAHERNPPILIKIIIVSLFILIPIRRICLLFFVIYDVYSMAESAFSEILSCSIMTALGITEVISRNIKSLEYIKGCPLLLFTFYTVSYTSFSYIPSKPSIVPM